MSEQKITRVDSSQQDQTLIKKYNEALATIDRLEATVESLVAVIKTLKNENLEKDKSLEKANAKCIRKDSQNSSTPPSKEIVSKPKKTQSLRKKGQKKQGGQKKHAGSHMKRMQATRTERSYPEECHG